MWDRVPVVLLLIIHLSESWRKIVGKLLRGRTKDHREIPMSSKYSVLVVGTCRINSIFKSKKFSAPLTSESVTSGQAGGVFRQLFLQCIPQSWIYEFGYCSLVGFNFKRVYSRTPPPPPNGRTIALLLTFIYIGPWWKSRTVIRNQSTGWLSSCIPWCWVKPGYSGENTAAAEQRDNIF